MSNKLDNYRKLASAKADGLGTYINVYNTGDNTISRVFSLIVCNSDPSVKTFRLWQTSGEEWQEETKWNNGALPEPVTAVKDRLFYDVEVPENLSFIVSCDLVLDNKQYLILEAPEEINITIWGEEEGNN